MTDTPKILRDMTDAEIGALVRAKATGKPVDFFDDPEWRRSTTKNIQPYIAYRIAPPKFLPLEAGKAYQTLAGDWICKFIDGDRAYCVAYEGSNAAYVWNANTGKSMSLSGGEYHIIGLSDNQEPSQ